MSISQQDVRSQRLAILEYARKHDFRIDDFIEATASGQAPEKRRRLRRADERPAARRPLGRERTLAARSVAGSDHERVPDRPLQLHEHPRPPAEPLVSVYFDTNLVGTLRGTWSRSQAGVPCRKSPARATGASTTDVMLAGNWKTSRMVAHSSAGATAKRGAVARYLLADHLRRNPRRLLP